MGKSGDIVLLESFESLASFWLESQSSSMWDCIFVLPPWLEAWWNEFGSEAELYLRAVRHEETVIGIAPLLLRGGEASFIGSADVCDYLDFVVVPGREVDFFSVLLDDLRRKGIFRLDLRPLRPDSTVLTHLVGMAQDRQYEISFEEEGISLEMDLPPTWQEYLAILTQKQRHEVRRKLRRLWEAGDVNYRVIEDSESASQSMDLFLRLFRESRLDKKTFLTARVESFFASLAKGMAQAGLLRLGILELNHFPAAAVMCFDYNNTVFLYNNGYDPRYESLSVGVISKILCIKDSVERGRDRFDFLKGAEEYKRRLGGKEMTLYGCQLSFE